jgi:hypothetical protein
MKRLAVLALIVTLAAQITTMRIIVITFASYL